MSVDYFIGIDPSMTSTGLIILDSSDEIFLEKTIKSNVKENNEKRIESIGSDILTEIWNITDVDTMDSVRVSIEGISYGSVGRGVAQQAALNYYIRILMLQRGVLYVTCAPTELKKFVTGKGQCKKDLMMLKTYKKWGVEFENSDLCDAYCLARFAKHAINKEN